MHVVLKDFKLHTLFHEKKEARSGDNLSVDFKAFAPLEASTVESEFHVRIVMTRSK